MSNADRASTAVGALSYLISLVLIQCFSNRPTPGYSVKQPIKKRSPFCAGGMALLAPGPHGSVLKLPAGWAHSMDQLLSAETGILGIQCSRGQEGQLMLWMLVLINTLILQTVETDGEVEPRPQGSGKSTLLFLCLFSGPPIFQMWSVNP